jgi:hypothetical protein
MKKPTNAVINYTCCLLTTPTCFGRLLRPSTECTASLQYTYHPIQQSQSSLPAVHLPSNTTVPIQPPCSTLTDQYNSPNSASLRYNYRRTKQSQSSLPAVHLPTNPTVPILPPCSTPTDQYNSPNSASLRYNYRRTKQSQSSLPAVHLLTNPTVPIQPPCSHLPTNTIHQEF